MPLIKSPSDKARQENIATEIHEGKPIKQAVAIGYSNQREEEHKRHMERVHERHDHEFRKYGR